VRTRAVPADRFTKPGGSKDFGSVSTIFEDSWTLEVFAARLSAAALAAIIVILYHFDNKRQPTWQHMSLNALISWLGTLAKLCITLLASRGIGQLKWVWFSERRRPLSDLGTFDAASRGPLGSLELLWLQKARHLATLGCNAMVLGLAFDPFLQNLLHTFPKSVEDAEQAAQLANGGVYNATGALQGGSGMSHPKAEEWHTPPGLTDDSTLRRSDHESQCLRLPLRYQPAASVGHAAICVQYRQLFLGCDVNPKCRICL